MERTLWASIDRLAPLGPSFVSVTYGAGGSTRERTHATVSRIARETSLAPAAHLTCVAASRAEIDEVVRDYAKAGIRHIVALRGDPVTGVGTAYEPTRGYAHACDLVEGIRRLGDFEVVRLGLSGEAPGKHRVSMRHRASEAQGGCGATRAITHSSSRTTVFRYLDKVRAAGIEIPILPGILPVTNFKQASQLRRPHGRERAGLAAEAVRGAGR